jgi:hypothetical protein
MVISAIIDWTPRGLEGILPASQTAFHEELLQCLPGFSRACALC